MECIETPATLQAAIELFADEGRAHTYLVQTRGRTAK